MRAPASPSRRRSKAVLRCVGSALALAVLAWILPLDELSTALAKVPWWGWIAGVVSFLCLHAFGTLKWRLTVNLAGARLALPLAARCYYYGLFGNTFLPSVVGGDLVRAGLALKHSHSRTGLLLGTLADRLLDVVALGCLAGLGMILIPGELSGPGRQILLWGMGVGSVAAIAGLLTFRFAIGFRSFKLRRKLVPMRQALRALARRPGRVLISLSLAMMVQGGLLGLNAWLGSWCGLDCSWGAWLFVWPLAKISAMLPVSQGGIGVREAALATLLAPFGVAAVTAVAVSLVFQAIILSGGLVSGLLAWGLGRWLESAGAVAAGPERFVEAAA